MIYSTMKFQGACWTLATLTVKVSANIPPRGHAYPLHHFLPLPPGNDYSFQWVSSNLTVSCISFALVVKITNISDITWLSLCTWCKPLGMYFRSLKCPSQMLASMRLENKINYVEWVWLISYDDRVWILVLSSITTSVVTQGTIYVVPESTWG